VRDFTLVIPTYNRAPLLAALLGYLEAEKADCRNLVLDSSRPEVMAANRERAAASTLDIEFAEFEDAAPREKRRQGFRKVEGWRGEHDERTLEHADIHALQSQLQAAHARQLAESERLRAEFRAVFNVLTEEKSQLQAELERALAQLEQMQVSTSWRLTEPLRAASRGFGALRSLGRRQ
jgi:hypothetical protein